MFKNPLTLYQTFEVVKLLIIGHKNFIYREGKSTYIETVRWYKDFKMAFDGFVIRNNASSDIIVAIDNNLKTVRDFEILEKKYVDYYYNNPPFELNELEALLSFLVYSNMLNHFKDENIKTSLSFIGLKKLNLLESELIYFFRIQEAALHGPVSYFNYYTPAKKFYFPLTFLSKAFGWSLIIIPFTNSFIRVVADSPKEVPSEILGPLWVTNLFAFFWAGSCLGGNKGSNYIKRSELNIFITIGSILLYGYFFVFCVLAIFGVVGGNEFYGRLAWKYLFRFL